ncbi:MAG: hypothetical protein ACJAZO_004426 [Myxococcota bacterium]|jgi:hypothetical protein
MLLTPAQQGSAVGVDLPSTAAKHNAPHLDGLPLPLELYAAHAGLFTPARLVQRVTSAMDLKLSRRGTAERLSWVAEPMA